MSTLVVNVASDVGATAIVRGLRAVSDFENELQMAQMNKQLSGIPTVFIPTSSAHSFIASRLLREVAMFGGDVDWAVPKPVKAAARAEIRAMTDFFDDESSRPTSTQSIATRPRDDRDAHPACARPRQRRTTTASVFFGDGRARRAARPARRALDRLPGELRDARWLLKERDEFLAARQREADQLLDDVRAQAERMVQRTEIVRQANQVAQRILEDAREEARRLRHEAEDYCDQKLAAFEIVLDRTIKTVKGGRAKLQVTPLLTGMVAGTDETGEHRRLADPSKPGLRGAVLRPGHRVKGVTDDGEPVHRPRGPAARGRSATGPTSREAARSPASR